MDRFALRLILALTAFFGLALAAHAEQILQETPLVQGALATATPFSVTGPGMVTVTLSDIVWPDRLASLTIAATTPNAVLASLSGPGTVSFKVTGAGVYDAVVGAVAGSSSFLNLGWYSLNIDFAPAVPLPQSAWLLLSALAALWLAVRRTPVTARIATRPR